jgi:signal transduction histidine kinase
MANETILVIEDNEKNRRLARDVLTYRGYKVVEAETAEDGLRLAAESPPDLVLMDIHLPGMNGIDALGHLRAGEGLQIAVSDTGVGIAAEDHEAIFEEFRQVGNDYTRKAEGTGLGLALTRRFVELHGGTIRVESSPGAGSTFTFTLPVRHG